MFQATIRDIFELVGAENAISGSKPVSSQELEQAMTRVEDDERDVQAAQRARQEARLELAEDFDEAASQQPPQDADVLKVEQEMSHLMSQVN